MTTELLNPMARDTQLFAEYDSSLREDSVCFFYIWDYRAISIGKIQRNREALIAEARVKGIPIYLRPTGGRAVLHGADICYTFVGALNRWGANLNESFGNVNSQIVKLINKKLKIRLSTNSNQSIAMNSNCFSSSVFGEAGIIHNGDFVKLLGAAQAMGRRSFIQQGSLQLNSNSCEIEGFTNQISLSSICGFQFDLDHIVDSLNGEALEC